jgi:hypothetical protein
VFCVIRLMTKQANDKTIRLVYFNVRSNELEGNTSVSRNNIDVETRPMRRQSVKFI